MCHFSHKQCRLIAGSDGLAVELRLQSDNQRPRLTVVLAEKHPLAVAQRDGVTPAEAHGFVLPTGV